MRTTIDKAGRVVIPRTLRDRIGLSEGGEVEVDIDGAGVRIEPVPGADLRKRGRLLVIPAKGIRIDEQSVREMIDAERDER